MTRGIDPHALQPEQLTDLRLLSVGATRKRGALWECARRRLWWLEREGYIVLGPSLPAGDKLRAVRRTVTVTSKGLEAIRKADAAVAAEGAA